MQISAIILNKACIIGQSRTKQNGERQNRETDRAVRSKAGAERSRTRRDRAERDTAEHSSKVKQTGNRAGKMNSKGQSMAE